MARIREELIPRRDLDDPAEVHDGDALAEVADGGEIVRDHQDADRELRAQIVEEREDRRLHRDVERRGRFVGDQDARLDGERPRDRDALALTTRERARVPVERGRGKPDELHQLTTPDLRGGSARASVHGQQLPQHAPDAQARVERREGILEDDLDRAMLLAASPRRELHAVEPEHPGSGDLETRDAPCERRLAAPGLADETERLAGLEVERDRVHGDQAARPASGT